MFKIIVFWGSFVISTTSLIFRKAAIFPMGVKNKGNVDVHDHNDWSDDEKNFKHTTWQDGALI